MARMAQVFRHGQPLNRIVRLQGGGCHCVDATAAGRDRSNATQGVQDTGHQSHLAEDAHTGAQQCQPPTQTPTMATPTMAIMLPTTSLLNEPTQKGSFERNIFTQ